MWGILLAFKDYQPALGFFASPWVGFKFFVKFVTSHNFAQLMRNTVYLAALNLVFYFPIPILLALLINEIRMVSFKRIIQTVTYLPHFFSWVVVVGITYVMLSNQGIVNGMVMRLGGDSVNFLMNPRTFRPIYLAQIIWKEAGWGTIIFLAAISAIDAELYEVSYCEGASRWAQLWHITLPGIKSTIVVILILRLGHFLDLGFEHVYLMLNSMNREVGEIFDTYVFMQGVQQGRFSYSTAVGLFKSVIGLVLVLSANRLAKRIGEEGIY
jgi:putative aldouronate transport system permease protein